ncbi:hypothetical protein FO501_27370 [Bacillus pacificus]|nr:hypothetical protein [Bacillus cereus]MDR4160575.1 hypothetical protein [Bacillus paranthracis]MDR4262043.1 hypothetical protein [Bacillus pacificus]PNS29807.1 hypothetical protein C1640_24275 [Bacillus sp. AKBS9]MDR4419885.1 hypothetical protein [Bacillus paranthracis]
MLLTRHWLFSHLSYVDFVLQMISPSFSPPFYKFRNICQKTIKYTNFDYSKTNFVKMCPLRENFKKGNTLRALEPQGIEKKFDFFFGTQLGKECCFFLV